MFTHDCRRVEAFADVDQRYDDARGDRGLPIHIWIDEIARDLRVCSVGSL